MEEAKNGTTISVNTIGAARTEYLQPVEYRLVKKRDGTLVLRGAYKWTEGWRSGHEWRDIPTEEEK